MNRIRASAIALVLCAIAPAQLLPSACAQSIGIASANSPAKGQAYGTGSYNLNGTTLISVYVVAYDQKGNLVSQGMATTNNGTWAGVVLGLTSGQTYQIGATLAYMSGGLVNSVQVPAANRIAVKVQ
jgi:hypothetical protein